MNAMKIDKTESIVMICDRNECFRTNLTVNNGPMEDVKEFTYLGSKVTKDGRSTKEISEIKRGPPDKNQH